MSETDCPVCNGMGAISPAEQDSELDYPCPECKTADYFVAVELGKRNATLAGQLGDKTFPDLHRAAALRMQATRLLMLAEKLAPHDATKCAACSKYAEFLRAVEDERIWCDEPVPVPCAQQRPALRIVQPVSERDTLTMIQAFKENAGQADEAGEPDPDTVWGAICALEQYAARRYEGDTGFRDLVKLVDRLRAAHDASLLHVCIECGMEGGGECPACSYVPGAPVEPEDSYDYRGTLLARAAERWPRRK